MAWTMQESGGLKSAKEYPTQRRFNLRIGKGEGFNQLGWYDAHARDEQFVGQLAEYHSRQPCRLGEKCRPAENTAQSGGELAVRNRIWRNNVYRPGKILILDDVADCANGVCDTDPTAKLFAIADPSAQTQLEWREHLPQSAAVARKHHAKSQQHYANVVLRRGLRCGLPLAAEVG